MTKVLHNFKTLTLTRPQPQEELVQRLIEESIHQPERKLAPQEISETIKKYAVGENIIGQRPLTLHSSKERIPEPEILQNVSDSIIYEFIQQLYQGEPIPQKATLSTTTEHRIPSPLRRFAARHDWQKQIRHELNHGCAAAFPAVANSSPEPTEDILNIEAFSPYLIPITKTLSQKLSPGLIIEATLFSDLGVKYSVSEKSHFQKLKTTGLEVLAYKEDTTEDSADAMTWHPATTEMFGLYISTEVPNIIRKKIRAFTEELCERAGLNYRTQKDNLEYLIHPGGTKIIQPIQEECGIPSHKVQSSYDLLKKYGNPSSAGCPALWQEAIEDPRIPVGQKILTVGLGPGLTTAGMILKKVDSNG